MKSGMLRLMRSWLFWFLILFQLVFIVVYSINYINTGNTNKERWYHDISEYNNDELLIENQIKNIEGQIDYLAQLGNESKDTEELTVYYTETLEILKYLQDSNYDYHDIQEAEVIYYREEDKRAYTVQMMEVLLWVNMAVSIVLLGLLVNAGKTNGAFVFEILLKGRKKIFFKEGKLYFIIMTAFFLYQAILVTGLGMQFPKKSQYILHYNHGDIKVIPEWLESVWAIIALFLSLFTVYVLHFILSQIINNIFTFSIVAVVATVGVKWLLVHLSASKFWLAFNISMNNIYENGISFGYYLFVAIAKYLLAGGLLYLAYLYCMKRKINTNID